MKQKNNLIMLALFGLLATLSTAYAADDDAAGGHGKEAETHEEEGADRTKIESGAADQAGIVTRQAQAGSIAETMTLTGRITLNRNTTVNVRGRFTGVVKSVHVELGEKVKKGQLLAKVESNESLQVYSVTSPINGVILERNVSEGDVADEEPLFRIADLSDVWAELHVFPKDLGHISEGLPVRVYTLDGDREARADIDLILPTANRLSQTVLAIVVLPNPERQWRPGMTVEGSVTIREKQADILVETSALQTLEGQQVVFVKEGDSYEARPVELGLSNNSMVEVLSGLSLGETYVAKGSFTIKADIGKESTAHGH
jgi:cobalt-zinc-cadmium efflux system membrane fusion protein